MNRLKTLVVGALLMAASSAWATYCTNGATNYPKCDNNRPVATTPAPVTSTSKSDASANAAAAAVAGASSKVGNVSAAGGAGGTSSSSAAGGDSTSSANNSLGAIGNDNSSNSFRALSLALPPPVFTPPLPISGCPQANVNQEATSVAVLFSHAKGSVNTDNCTAIIIYNNLLARCKYRQANRVLATLTSKVLPGYESSGDEAVDMDLTENECRVLHTPRPVEPKLEPISIAIAPPACPTPPAPAKRKSVARATVTGCKG